MLVLMVPLHEDGTPNEAIATKVIDDSDTWAWEAAGSAERAAREVALFRDAKALFEAKPELLERMQRLVARPVPPSTPPPDPAADPVFAALTALHRAIVPHGDDARLRRITVAPEDGTICFQDWIDWKIWHVGSTNSLAVYRNGQPFGEPSYTIWVDPDEAGDDID